MRRFFKHTSGSVMMECLITLPLHLLALLGTVYLGTLSTDRNAVVSMDHFCSFVSQTSLAGVQTFYHPDDTFITFEQKAALSTPESSSYLYLSRSRVEAVRTLPIWLEGIRSISRVILQLQDENNPLLAAKQINSSNASDGGAAAVLQNPGYAVNRAETTDWAAVANESFLFGPAPAAVTAQDVSAYTRDSDCETWSVEKL